MTGQTVLVKGQDKPDLEQLTQTCRLEIDKILNV